ncbi:MAG: site-2 protease family protein [Polyangiaceae bacterium]|nr:site-2 protease family protein [Polyangiaceae bacterium]
MRNAIRIGRLFGIDFKIDSSWVIIAALVIWSLSSLFAAWHPEWALPTRLVVATLAMLAFFGSVVLHELAHSMMSRFYGIPVRDITLHMFGGVSSIEREPPTPGAEFIIAIVGPIASVLLGIGMLVVAAIFTDFTLEGEPFASAAEAISRMGPLSTLLVWLGPVNIMVGLFNMVPGFPLDGGRVLRSILWRITKSLPRATELAAWIGQLVGWAFLVTGIFMALGYRVPFFGTGFGSGLWLGLIGLFLRNAAVQHRIGVAAQSALGGLHVADVMRASGPWVNANMPLRAVVDDYFTRHDETACPVFDDTSFVGLISLGNIRKVPMAEWDRSIAADRMTPLAELKIATRDDDLFETLRQIGTSGVHELAVMSEGRLVGIIFEKDIFRWLELRSHSSSGPVHHPDPRHA